MKKNGDFAGTSFLRRAQKWDLVTWTPKSDSNLSISRKWDLVLKNSSCASEMGQWQVTSNTNRGNLK